jgi:hypothetical protein
LQKTLTVLNPFASIDHNIMDDADLAGPFLVWCAFAFVLLLVSVICDMFCVFLVPRTLTSQSGKSQFSHIYGLGLLGTSAIYVLLNLMSDSGIDAYRTASILGYCLLPMVGLGSIGIGIGIDHLIGYVLSVLSVLWCTYAASSIFVTVLRMSHQRLLVAYPVGLLYGCFALLSIFRVAK